MMRGGSYVKNLLPPCRIPVLLRDEEELLVAGL
jgi:hypothetical protein